jgi:hypothetical protein
MSFIRVYTLTPELASLGGVGVPQAVYQCTADGLGVWSRASEGAAHARLDGAAGDSLAVAADE